MTYDNKKVLVVEDDDMNRMLASMSLGEFEITPDEAADGKQALDMFLASPEGTYDLIMMDVMMPVMDGIESTKNIRSSGRSDCNLPIVAMTAESDENEIHRFIQEGLTDYIEKPMEMESLELILNKYLG